MLGKRHKTSAALITKNPDDMATSESNNSNVPKAADHDQLTNRMNMALSKRSALMSSLRGPKAATRGNSNKPQQQQQQDQKSTSTSTTTSKPAPTSFSSLLSSGPARSKSKTASLSSSSSQQNQQQQGKQPKKEDDDGFDRLGGFNQGLGYVNKAATDGAAAASSAANKAEDAVIRDLRGKLLGKRAREQREEAAARKGKKVKGPRKGKAESSDDDDDEEEGRSSAVAKKGRGKK